jgi:hypothetical protein
LATYSKRGYKAPKERAVEETVEGANSDEKAQLLMFFTTLDDSASKPKLLLLKPELHHWLCRSCRFSNYWLFSIKNSLLSQNNWKRRMKCLLHKKTFNKLLTVLQAIHYILSLNGSEGKFGFIKIADEYSGTDAGNLANYYAGMAYLNTGKYNEAIDYLNKFKSDDIVLSGLATGAIGDMQKTISRKKKNYVKAAGINKNDFTTPFLLVKSWKTALALGKRGCS